MSKLWGRISSLLAKPTFLILNWWKISNGTSQMAKASLKMTGKSKCQRSSFCCNTNRDDIKHFKSQTQASNKVTCSFLRYHDAQCAIFHWLFSAISDLFSQIFITRFCCYLLYIVIHRFFQETKIVTKISCLKKNQFLIWLLF